MTDLNPQSDQNQTPEDVATLYSWANLHGAKYRDFSASRAQTREKARLRAEQALEEEHRDSGEAVIAAHAADDERAAEEVRVAEAARQAEIAAEEAALQAGLAAQQATQDAAQQQAAQEAARQAELEAARRQAAHEAAQQQAEQEAAARQTAALDAARQEAATQEATRQEAAQEAARLEAERLESEQAARQAAEEEAERATQLALQQAREQAAQLAVQQAAQQAQAAKEALAAKQAAERAAEQVAQPRGWQPWTDRFAQPAAATTAAPVYSQAQGFDQPGLGRPQAARPADAAPQFAPARDEAPAQARNPWATPETREPVGRPAWLSAANTETAGAQTTYAPLPHPPQPQPPISYPPVSNPPEDTLQGSRDRLTSRWFALRGVFDPTAPPLPEAVPAPVVSRAPALAVFSLAGGVGKTSLVATLGRALSARGERVLLVDTAAFGLLPFFFGATDQRPGQLRTFGPPGVSSDAPVQMVTIDPEGLAPEQSNQESLSGEITKFARGASRVIVDLATASGATTRRIMRMAPLVLVPVVPDMNSVVSVSSIDAFFEHNSIQAGKTVLPYYVLNQFDATLPLHLDVREVLREQLGERLLPFALRRTPAMSEALAEGMTVMDYAPGSMLAEDFVTLAGWVKSLSAPATTSYRGVRWSER